MKITWAKNIRLTYSIFQLYSYNKYEKRGIIPANGIVPICSHKRVTVFSLGKLKGRLLFDASFNNATRTINNNNVTFVSFIGITPIFTGGKFTVCRYAI